MSIRSDSNRILAVVFHEGGGAGRPVEVREYGRRHIEGFARAVADAVAEGRVASPDFAAGFVAGLDALANGMLDEWSPGNVVAIAYCDAGDPSSEGWALSEAVRRECGRMADGRG